MLGKMLLQVIIVSPNAGGNPATCWNGYFNMPGWAYEDFFYKEFLPYIEKTYRVKGDKRHRAIAGLSMGGGGTASYAQRYPDMYCAAYAMSALMNIPVSGEEEAWIALGRTSQILDNLIAQGKAKPMIVVMTNGNAWQDAAAGQQAGSCHCRIVYGRLPLHAHLQAISGYVRLCRSVLGSHHAQQRCEVSDL
jgi:pimeloyl-ACP methyl ester carboxylesterase